MKRDPWWLLEGEVTPILFLIALMVLFGLIFEAPVFVLVAGVGIACVLVFRRRRRRAPRDG
jgi:Sec-independent protein secretion pathway component TatC